MRVLVFLALLVAPAAPLVTQPASENDLGPVRRVDRIVAVVDADPIFESDLVRARALATDTSPPGRDALLQQVIDERLRSHEVERAEIPPVADAAVSAQLASIAQRFADTDDSGTDDTGADDTGTDTLPQQLARLGLTLDDLRLLVRRRLRLLAYIDERLGPRVFIDPQDIEAYYYGPLSAEMAARDEPIPALDDVRDAIADLLYQRALSREIDVWTDRLRSRAEILRFGRVGDLPPTRRVLTGTTTSEKGDRRDESAQQTP